MAQPARRQNSTSESRRRNMESSSHGNAVVNGVASEKPKVSQHSSDANSSPYSQSISCTSKSGHGEMTRRTSQKDKPVIPAKPPLSKVPPPRHSKTVTTTTVHSKSQSQVTSCGKKEMGNRVNGAEVKRNSDLNGEVNASPGSKRKVCLEITLEKKVSTPTSVRRKHDRDIAHSAASSSEDSSPSQSPSKSVHFKSSRSSSISSTDSKDRYRPIGYMPRYQTHTLSSIDKIHRAKSATARTGSGSESSSDTQLNGSSSAGSVEPINRGRARSVGPIRRVRSNEMMPIRKDLSPPSKSGTKSSSQVRSKSVERTKNRQSFGGFVQRQRKAWEERVTTVTKRHSLRNVPEKNGQHQSMDPNHAPKIMQKVTVTERKHMLFGKGTKQKVKNTIDENQVNKPTSPTFRQNKSDVSPQVPKTKSSHSDAEVRTSAQTEAHGHSPTKGTAQGDSVLNSEHSRTNNVESPPEKPSVLQEIAPSQSSKPNAPSSLPIKPVHNHHSDSNHRVSPSKENNIGTLVMDMGPSAVNGTDELDNGKHHLFISEDPLIGKPESIVCKQQSSDLERQEGFSEILGLTNPKEINKLNSETHQGVKKVDNTFVSVEKVDAKKEKVDAKKDKVKEQEKVGVSNGEDFGEKDGHYFLKFVNEEQSRIEALCRKVEGDLDGDMPDEASGIYRAFLGKANLLTSKKFKQFRGLCEENITKTPSPETGRITLNSDLAGFWDMVLIQVDEIHSKFIDIEAMRENNWKVVTPPKVNKPTPHKTPGKRTYGRQMSRDKDKKAAAGGVDANKNKKNEDRAAKMRATREEARKRLMEAKKQAARQRIRSSNSETEVEIFTASGPQQ